MKTAVGYIRVSTREQAQDGISVDTQRMRIKAFALAKGWKFLKLYGDKGFSGKDLNRPNIQSIIEGAKCRAFDVVIVYKIDRISRRQKDLWHLIEDVFEPNAIGFVSVTEPFDTTTAQGKAFLGMLGIFAQLERDTISERTRDALSFKKKNGEHIGAPPLGYKVKGKSLEPIADEIEVIDIATALRNEGRSLREIANCLNLLGLRSKRGGKFHSSTVHYILKNSKKGA